MLSTDRPNQDREKTEVSWKFQQVFAPMFHNRVGKFYFGAVYARTALDLYNIDDIQRSLTDHN